MRRHIRLRNRKRDPRSIAAPTKYDYFDEDYFEQGHLRGTAYTNYRRSARRSPTYRELAERIIYVFRPARALEVGCATGIVVHHLNALGCDAHGIDVSEWAVAHREHPNVVLAGAEDLPYEDDSFDLVFSVHALEHIPPELEEAALSELTRVSRPAALQFHLLPIVGRGPYGTPEAIAGLRNDPTHNLIRTLGEWSARWRQFGWSETGLLVLVRNDTESFELSSCHYVLARQDVPRDVIERIRDSNLDVAQSLFTTANKTRATPLDVLTTTAPIQNPAELRFVASQWQDLAATFDPPAQLSGAAFHLTTTLEGESMQRIRLAVVNDDKEAISGEWRHVAERWFDVPPGLAHITVRADDLSPLRGDVDFAAVAAVYLGGSAANCRLQARLDIEVKDVRTRII